MIAAQLARASAAAGSAMSAAIAGRRRRQAPGPWTGSIVRSISAAQAGSSRAIRSGSISRRPTLARGSRAVVIPTTTRVRTRSGRADREAERGHRAHRVAGQVERREPERVGERLEVVDQPAGLEPVGRVPARRRRGRARRADRGGTTRRAPGSGAPNEPRPVVDAPWSRTSGGAVADRLVGDRQAVGVDRGHRVDATRRRRRLRGRVSRAALQSGHDRDTGARATRTERDSMGEMAGPGRRAVRRLDPAGRPQLPDLRPADAAALPARAGADQARRGRDERRARPARPRRRRGDRGRGRIGRRRRPRRPVPDRHLPDGLGAPRPTPT